jgi:hypothetical protein
MFTHIADASHRIQSNCIQQSYVYTMAYADETG